MDTRTKLRKVRGARERQEKLGAKVVRMSRELEKDQRKLEDLRQSRHNRLVSSTSSSSPYSGNRLLDRHGTMSESGIFSPDSSAHEIFREGKFIRLFFLSRSLSFLLASSSRSLRNGYQKDHIYSYT